MMSIYMKKAAISKNKRIKIKTVVFRLRISSDTLSVLFHAFALLAFT